MASIRSRCSAFAMPLNRFWFLGALFLNWLILLADAGKDYYSILGVSKNADERQIKRAYKKQAMRWHPDKHQKSKDKDKATAKFQEIAEAYETLTDPEKRKLYDLGGEEAVKGKPQSPPGSDKGFAQGATGGQNTDPAMFEAYLRKMSGSFGRGGGSGTNPFEFVFTQMPGRSDMGGFGGTSNSFSQPRKPTQGKAFFTGSSAVRELTFKGHESEISKLKQQGNVAVLFYASGGKSCPKACHEIRTHYAKFAAASQHRLPVVAVQCTHRRELCATYSDRFPAVVLFSQDASQPHILSEATAATAAELQQKLERVLAKAKVTQDAVELNAKHFAANGDPCDGKFCLLLLEHHSTGSKARDALKEAAKLLKNEPVKVFYVQESKHPEFVGVFGSAAGLGLRGKRPATQAVIYRPRRQTYELFNGNVQDGNALANFATSAVHRGSPLPHRLLENPKMYA